MLNNTGTIRAVKIRQTRGLLVVCLLTTSISFDFDWFFVSKYFLYITFMCVYIHTYLYLFYYIYNLYIYINYRYNVHIHWAWLTKSFWRRIACCTVELWMRRNAIVLMHRWRCRFGLGLDQFLWLENPQAKVTDGAQVSRLTIEFQNLSLRLDLLWLFLTYWL